VGKRVRQVNRRLRVRLGENLDSEKVMMEIKSNWGKKSDGGTK
jgi:hypothetical protein